MKRIHALLLITFALLFVITSCSDDDDLVINPLEATKYVNDWIYEDMNIYYLWNNDIPKKPDFTLNPEVFFESILSKKDRTKNNRRFSWIQENYIELLGSLSGVSSDDIGFDYKLVGVKGDEIKLYAFVKYPKLGSDADSKGIKRGRVIVAVDDKDITRSNYSSIFSGTGIKKLSMADFIYNTVTNKYDLKRTEDVSINMEKNFAETPVYMDTVYTDLGPKNIGYMVYNFFATGRTNKTHEYDKLLMNALTRIKAKGATEMVLDLRYNNGGATSSAHALASALVKNRNTKNILVTTEYNDLVHAAFKKQEGSGYNKEYFIEKVIGTNIVIPALNLPRLYVLVTGESASASELIINGLRPYMDVILIGETTYGKYVGSFSIYEENDPKNKWAMQPITFKYSNSRGESDFTTGFVPQFEVNEFQFLPYREFGNTEDPLLSVALNQITGRMQTRSMSKSRQIATNPEMIELKKSNSMIKDRSRFEMYDDIRGERIKMLMKEKN